MLKISIPSAELWDERKNEFVNFKGATLVLEHSLVSISKWEAKYHKPFITNRPNDVKTNAEMVYYIKCMTLTQNVPDEAYDFLTNANINDIRAYMEDPMTATTLASGPDKGPKNAKPITSEQIYYWMIVRNIPIEFQKWHINRLLMLIKVCDFYNNQGSNKKGPKRSKAEMAASRTALNNSRRAALKSKG